MLRPTPTLQGAPPTGTRLTDPAIRPALVLLVTWLLVTTVPLVGAGRTDAGALARHLVLVVLAAVALAITRRGAGWMSTSLTRTAPRTTRVVVVEWAALFVAWLPLVAVPALYAEIPLIAGAIAGADVAPMRDPLVIRWEFALFARLVGDSPATALARWAPWTPLSEVLHLAYLAYYAIIYVPPALLWWDARRGRPGRSITGAADPWSAFAASAFTVVLAFVLCYAVFIVFPVQGPWYTWHTGDPDGLPLTGPVRAFVQGLLVAGSSRGTAFPSSHVAVSVAQTVVLARVAPRLAWVVGPTMVLLAIGAVYGGYHYGVDAIAGAVLGGVAGAVGPRLWGWWSRGGGEEIASRA